MNLGLVVFVLGLCVIIGDSLFLLFTTNIPSDRKALWVYGVLIFGFVLALTGLLLYGTT